MCYGCIVSVLLLIVATVFTVRKLRQPQQYLKQPRTVNAYMSPVYEVPEVTHSAPVYDQTQTFLNDTAAIDDNACEVLDGM